MNEASIEAVREKFFKLLKERNKLKEALVAKDLEIGKLMGEYHGVDCE